MFSIQLVAVLLFLAGCSSAPEAETSDPHAPQHDETFVEFTQAQYDNAEIKVGNVEYRSLSNTLKVSGIVDAPPQNMISISAPYGGYVVSTDLLSGMKVKKGQKLITLEHQDYIQLQQDYLDKKSQLDFLEMEYARQQKLRNENVNSDKVFQQTASQYKSMKAQVSGMQEKLAYIGINASKINENSISRRVTLYSPSNGYISKVNTNIGKYCNPTDVLIEIINTEHLHAELTVYEKDLGKISIGQSVRVIIPSSQETEVMAKVYLIGKAIGNDRALKVHAHFDKENETLVPGMYINASIETKSNRVSAVPEKAVLQFEGKNYLVLLDGESMEGGKRIHHFKLLEIETGVSEFGYTEVISKEGIDFSKIRVVTEGAYSVLSKLKNTDDEGGGHGH